MIVAISGASGFIGQNLIRKFNQNDFTIRIIDRQAFSLSDHDFMIRYIESADVVINLAGAPVAKRWTPEYQKEILSSRIDTTRKIADAINAATNKPKLFISNSAIGIYDSKETHTESSRSFAGNFLAKVCSDWEEEANRVQSPVRVVIFRIGVVLGSDGGALQKMHRPFSIGLGGKLGTGKQAMSFIHIHDLVNAFMFAIGHETFEGVVNAVSPYPSYNAEFTDKLGKVLGQPTWFTVPPFALKLAFGDGAQVLLEGQSVLPEKLMQEGFTFRFPTIQNALVDIFS